MPPIAQSKHTNRQQVGDFLYQWGTAQASTSNDVTVAFPVPFVELLNLTFSVVSRNSHNTFANSPARTNFGFEFSCIDLTQTRRAEYINWFAVGRI